MRRQLSLIRIVSLQLVMLASAASLQATIYTVTTTNDSGAGSLRQAILSANANPSADTIEFNLPGTGVQTILLSTPLPEITNTVSINGYSQPGSRTNSLASGNDAKLLVRLDGWKLPVFSRALVLKASGCSVRGLIVVRFYFGIRVDSGFNNVIAGNWVGIDWDNVARGMTNEGIDIYCLAYTAATGNMIGGTTPADRNVISGNGTGVSFFPANSSHNSVIGNFIGTDLYGVLPRGNVFEAIKIQTATNITIRANVLASCTGAGGTGIKLIGSSGEIIQQNYIGIGPGDTGWARNLGHTGNGIDAQGCTELTIGGDQPELGNQVGFNSGHGISLSSCSLVAVKGNVIGTGPLGTEAYGNAKSGIYLNNSSSNTIGAAAAPNQIRFNGAAGISVVTGASGGTCNNIRPNSIAYNAGLGIDLGDNGVTVNDAGDTDTGANELQNYPDLTTATRTGSALQIEGTLQSQPNTAYRLDFYVSDSWDAQWIPEGRAFVGSTDVITSDQGAATFAFSGVGQSWMAAGYKVTATATDPLGNTSEFSAAADLTAAITLPVQLTITRQDNAIQLTWPASAGPYQPESTSTPGIPESWVPVNGVVEAAGIKSCWVTNTGAPGPILFRIKAL